MVDKKINTDSKEQIKRAWLFLFIAIALEIVGVTVMKMSADSDSFIGLAFMYVMIGVSFFLLGKSMRYLPLALTYATWQTVGLIAITFIGFQFFDEKLSVLKIIGMAVLLFGVLLINKGVKK